MNHYGLHRVGFYECIRGIVSGKYRVRHAGMAVDVHRRCSPTWCDGWNLAEPGQSGSDFFVLKMSEAMAIGL
jgi:hypothetical protein